MKTLKITRTALLSLIALMGISLSADSHAKEREDGKNTRDVVGTLRILPLNAPHIDPQIHAGVKEQRALNFVRTLIGQGLTVSYNGIVSGEEDIVVTFTPDE